MEFGLSASAGYGTSHSETATDCDFVPGGRARDIAALDRIVDLLALTRVRLTMVALDFDGVHPRLASQSARAAAGATGFLIALGSRRFVIVDIGPRGASTRDDQAIAERVRALAMAFLLQRSDARRLRFRSAELHLWSDQAGASAQRLSELERLLDAGERRQPAREQRRRGRDEAEARVA